MPKIKWVHLPPQLRQHLFDRAKERKKGQPANGEEVE
jgi:hypothetical protein